MIVNAITINGERQPDIDETIYSGYTVIQDFGSTMEVEVTKRPERIAAEEDSMKAGVQLIVAEIILNGTLPTERLDEFALTFDTPEIKRTYKQTWILRDPVTDELFEVIKAEHTWLGIWKMEEIPSEFKPHRKAGAILPWVQPLSTNPYRLLDQVTHNGKTWISRNDANVWEPGTVNSTIWEEVL